MASTVLNPPPVPSQLSTRRFLETGAFAAANAVSSLVKLVRYPPTSPYPHPPRVRLLTVISPLSHALLSSISSCSLDLELTCRTPVPLSPLQGLRTWQSHPVRQ
jgi:hypothetical protein